MIPISKIDPKLEIYKNKTLVLWGAGEFGSKILNQLRYLGTEVSYFCDNDEKNGAPHSK